MYLYSTVIQFRSGSESVILVSGTQVLARGPHTAPDGLLCSVCCTRENTLVDDALAAQPL